MRLLNADLLLVLPVYM